MLVLVLVLALTLFVASWRSADSVDVPQPSTHTLGYPDSSPSTAVSRLISSLLSTIQS